MRYKAEIHVMPKKEILDPQGKAVMLGLDNLGVQNIHDVRVGRHIDLELEADSKEDAEGKVEQACKKLLANVIMETYSFNISEI